MQDTEAALDHRELDHRQEVDGELLEARREPPALFEPADQALDDVAPAVRGLIEARVRRLIFARRDHRADPAAPQLLPDAGIAIALIAGEAAWLRARAAAAAPGTPQAHGPERGLDEARLVRLPGTHHGGERDAVAVDDQMQLGAEAAARAPQRVIRGLIGRRRHVFFPPRRPLRDWPGSAWRR